MTDQLPYTLDHPDPDSDVELIVGERGIALQTPTHFLEMPLGDLTPEEAARAARAVLAAAGDTGYAVFSKNGVLDAEEVAAEEAARSMRERAVRALTEGTSIVSTLRALPLLPDDAGWPEDDENLGCGPHCQCDKPTSAGLYYRALLVAELLGATPDDAAEELDDDPTGTWERAYAAWTNHRRDAATRTNTRYEERLDALEGLTRAVVDLIETHSVDLSQAKAAIRGLARRPLTADTDH